MPPRINDMLPLVSRIAADLDRAYRAALALMRVEPGDDAAARATPSADEVRRLEVQRFVVEFEKMTKAMRSYQAVRREFLAAAEAA